MPKEFLVFSDLHAHNHTYGATRVPIPGLGGLYNSRLADTAAVLDELLDYAKDHAIHEVVFCGDLFHRRTSVQTDVRYVVTDRLHKFTDEDIHLYLIPGNHDMGDRKGNYHSLIGLGELSDYIHVYDKTNAKDLDDVQFVFLPYSDDIEEAQRRLQVAGNLADYTDKPSILFAHLGMQGAKVGSDYVLISDSDIKVSDVPSQKFAACFFGHFHEHQQLFGNGWVVGATHQHNWGDAGGARGFLHVKVQEDQLSFERITTEAPEFVVSRDGDKLFPKPNDFVKIITKHKFLDKEELKAGWGLDNLEIIIDTEDDDTEFTLQATQLSPLAVLEQWVTTELPVDLDKDDVLNIGKDILKEVGYD